MTDARFYHIVRSPAETLLPSLIGKAQAAGWRVELRGRDRPRMERIDALLWQGDGFLPHGLAGGPYDAAQPVLLSVEGETGPGNGADCLMALDGAAIDMAEASRLARICVIFDGADEPAVDLARAQWRALTAAGVAAEYWSDASGRWERKR